MHKCSFGFCAGSGFWKGVGVGLDTGVVRFEWAVLGIVVGFWIGISVGLDIGVVRFEWEVLGIVVGVWMGISVG